MLLYTHTRIYTLAVWTPLCPQVFCLPLTAVLLPAQHVLSPKYQRGRRASLFTTLHHSPQTVTPTHRLFTILSGPQRLWLHSLHFSLRHFTLFPSPMLAGPSDHGSSLVWVGPFLLLSSLLCNYIAHFSFSSFPTLWHPDLDMLRWLRLPSSPWSSYF